MQPTIPALLLALSLSFAVGSATAAERALPKSPAMAATVLADDARLNRAVTLAAPHLPIGALLEQITAATGVELATDDRLAPLSGYEVTAVVQDRPAREVLESLALLYSTRTDRWYWVRQRRQAQTRYVLRNSQAAEAVREREEKELRSFLLSQHQQTKEFYRRSEAQRAAAAEANPYFQALNDPRFFERNANFFSFISHLGERDLLAIMGGQALEIPTSRLSPAQREFMRREYEMSNPRNESGEPLPGPDQLEAVKLSFRQGTISLGLGSIGGYGVLGGIWSRRAMQARAREEWLGSGGETDAPDQTVPAPGEKTRPEELQITNTTLPSLLHRLGRMGKLSLLFDCPPEARGSQASMDFTLAGPLPKVLANLEQQLVVWKRNGPFLLFRRPDWPQCTYHSALPWPLLKELRATAHENRGYLRPEQWPRLASLNQPQLERLSKEFPDASQVLQWQLPLRLAATMSDRERALLARPEGAQAGDWSPETWKRLHQLFPPEEARRVRFLLQWDTEGEAPKVRFHFGPADAPVRPVVRTFRKQRPPEVEMNLTPSPPAAAGGS